MPHSLLVTTAELAAHLGDSGWLPVDCRFSLSDVSIGRRQYDEGHIPGAVYAHLDDDLSGPVKPGQTGRHPLPAVPEVAARFSAWGIEEGVQVVAYDDAGGQIAARLWWLLRYLGHDAVALLDGGLNAWLREERPLSRSVPERQRRTFRPEPRPGMVVSAQEIEGTNLSDRVLLDARAEARFRGEEEPIDAVAGHIPGARSAPYLDSLNAEGAFLPPDALRRSFLEILDGASPEEAVAYCGSGVSAAHLALAMERAGLPRPRLYPGSWSEWITDPSREIATR